MLISVWLGRSMYSDILVLRDTVLYWVAKLISLFRACCDCTIEISYSDYHGVMLTGSLLTEKLMHVQQEKTHIFHKHEEVMTERKSVMYDFLYSF